MTQQAIRAEALSRATSSQALTNLPTIYAEFVARGIPEDEIKPRENVFTFHAWKALGRSVKKGEHGVRITTWVPMSRTVKADDGTEKEQVTRRCKSAHVFHVSQTEPSRS